MKNVNKNNLRFLLTGVTIGGLIFGGIGVAASTLTANQIKYTPSNENFKATNAEEALNEIYKIAEYKIPEDTYFYEEGTEGDSTTIVRYKKINNEYFLCDANGIVLEGTDATDVTSKNLIPYTAENSGNISAGAAGYALGKLYLGDGSDNKAYYDAGITFNKGGEIEYIYKDYVGNGNRGTSVTITLPEAGTYYILSNVPSLTPSLGIAGLVSTIDNQVAFTNENDGADWAITTGTITVPTGGSISVTLEWYNNRATSKGFLMVYRVV